MKRVAVLTDLLGYDEAYSVAQGARNNVRMLTRAGYAPTLLMRRGRTARPRREDFAGARIVEVAENSEDVVRLIQRQFEQALAGAELVFTHDLIFQANLWEARVAYRRLAEKRPGLRWLHWVHSLGQHYSIEQTGLFAAELEGPPPNAKIVALTPDTAEMTARRARCEFSDVVVVPHPIDFCEGFHPVAQAIVDRAGLMEADAVAVYPCRLDRGKRPHVLVEIFAALRETGLDARLVVADFHSTDGDKAAYRREMMERAEDLGVPVFFVSEMGQPAEQYGATVHYKKALDRHLVYSIPRKAVADLMALADVLVQPSVSESYSRIVAEAAWARCLLVLNADLPAFRQWSDLALMFSFSDFEPKEVAGAIADRLENNAELHFHARMRKERSLEAVWEKCLRSVVEGDW